MLGQKRLATKVKNYPHITLWLAMLCLCRVVKPIVTVKRSRSGVIGDETVFENRRFGDR